MENSPGTCLKAAGLSAALEELPHRLKDKAATLGDLLSVLGERAVAMVLLVFAIPAIIPTPGLPAGFIFGTALALLSVQLIWGAERFVLPRRLAGIPMPAALLRAMANKLAPWLAYLERFLKPRARYLSGRKALPVLGVVVLVMAILIALPIPFGNILPGLSVFLIALGIAERDGVAIGAGLLFGVAALAFSGFIFWGGWALMSGFFAGDAESAAAG
ncbi:exopolysaccharide biosynthesis protein [Rhizobium oryzicola]|uniref:Exopolysaccharide biosynthesis protein n=1 Tax=Rhizobium oryzicola TaxID=1232668 RepID=A0ABT8T0C1_9HYPH|nr:exopolysaccharide biosynthesis protein [Rhizobium oryzicola]MDO1584071.1 exopolysaccharide biosynthesis protein [Rhizobium oryzicola]